MEYKEFKPIIIATIVMIAITLSLTMTGCIAPDGTWEFDGTVKHADDEVVPSPTPEIVYVTQTPEVVYVTVTPTPEPFVCTNGNMRGDTVCPDGQIIYTDICQSNKWVATGDVCPEPFVCTNGNMRGDTVCPDGQIIYTDICQSNKWVATGDVCPEPTRPPLEVHSGGCDGLDQNVLRRYDFDNSGLIDRNEMETAKLGYENNYEKPYDYAQVLYAYEHSCPVWSFVCNDGELRGGMVCPDGQVIYTEYCDHNVWVPTGDTCPEPEPTPTPTVQPTPVPTPEPTFDDPVIVIDPPIYSGVVRKNGEILDIRITPDPLIAGGDLRIEIDVLNTGTTTTCYELEFLTRDPERWIYPGDMETFVFTSLIGDPGDRSWVFELYWDAEWPASNVLLQTATADVHCYTQYEVDNM